MVNKQVLKTLIQTYTKPLFICFFLLNSVVLGYKYYDLYLDRGLKEFQGYINGILLTNYFIWFIGIMTFITVNRTLSMSSQVYKKKTSDERSNYKNIVNYYIYHLMMSFSLVFSYQLFVHLFLPISILDSLKIVVILTVFNAIYYFILISLSMTASNLIKGEAATLLVYFVLFYGFVIAPVIKLGDISNNLFLKLISWMDLYALFTEFYLSLATVSMNLPITYSIHYHGNYMEKVFHYIALNNLNDGDYYQFYIHVPVNNSYLLLGLIILLLVVGNLLSNYKRKDRL